MSDAKPSLKIAARKPAETESVAEESRLPPPTRRLEQVTERSPYWGLIPPLLGLIALIAGGMWFMERRAENTAKLTALTASRETLRREAETAGREFNEMEQAIRAAKLEIEKLNRERFAVARDKAENALRLIEDTLRTEQSAGAAKLAEIASRQTTVVQEDTSAADRALNEAEQAREKVRATHTAITAENASMRAWLKTHNKSMHRSF